jgi:hypothetical protein
MDILDMTFDPAATRQVFPDLPETDIGSVLARWLAGQGIGLEAVTIDVLLRYLAACRAEHRGQCASG